MLKKAQRNVAGRKNKVTKAIVRIEIASFCVSFAILKVVLLSISAMRLKY